MTSTTNCAGPQPAASMLDAALAWAARGFRVFPITSNGKVPFEQGWTLSATTNLEQVRARWTDPVTHADRGYNVGVLTSDHVVVDVDTKAGKPGLETMMRLGLEFDTLTVRTPTGGWHLYFKGIGREVGQSPLGPGLDVRSHHGYAVAPGSTIDGVPYVVELDLPVAEFPHELRPLLKAPRSRRANGVSVELDQPESLEIAAHWLRREAPAAVQGENGDDRTYRVACRVRDYGVSEEATLDLMLDEWNPRCEPPWSVHELRLKVENAFRYATGAAGAASPASLFEGVVDVPKSAAARIAHDSPSEGSAQADRSSWRTIHIFCAAYEPLSYVMEPIVRTGSIYTLTARTGHGKTALAVVLTLAIATGRSDILGAEVVRGRVAYCAFENPDDVRMRFMAAAFRLGIDLEEISDSFVVRDARASPEKLAAELREMSAAVPFSLVVIDTFAAGFDGNDVNDNVQAGEFVRRLRPITQLPGRPALLIPAHPTKNATEDQVVPYGGGAILNEVDGNLTLVKRVDAVLHWQGKYRGLDFAPMHFRFETVEARNVLDAKGRAVSLPVLLPCAADDAERHVRAAGRRDLAILQAIAADPEASVRDLSKATGFSRSSVDRQLKELRARKLVEKSVTEGWRLTRRGVAEVGKIDAPEGGQQ